MFCPNQGAAQVVGVVTYSDQARFVGKFLLKIIQRGASAFPQWRTTICTCRPGYDIFGLHSPFRFALWTLEARKIRNPYPQMAARTRACLGMSLPCQAKVDFLLKKYPDLRFQEPTAPFQNFDPLSQTSYFVQLGAARTTPPPRRLLKLSVGASAGTK